MGSCIATSYKYTLLLHVHQRFNISAWALMIQTTALLLLAACTGHQRMAVSVQAFNFVTALNPFSPTFDEDNQRDVKKRPRGPTQKAMDPISRPQEYLGTSGGFGFTKKNELFVGRVAMLVSLACPCS